MITTRPHVQLWRLVLETQTAMSIGTGFGDGVNDVVLAHDANGLPMLPASALAGVLRSAWTAEYGGVAAAAVFGFAEGSDGQISRVAFSHGHIHDASDSPVLGLDPRGESDAILAPLLSRRPLRRQRVRIDHRGVAADAGLFDRSVLPAGHRFSVELQLWSENEDQAKRDGQRLEQLLATGALRLGGLTRSGLGRLQVKRGASRRFDLKVGTDFEAFVALDRSIGVFAGLDKEWNLPATEPAAGFATLVVSLTPEAGFRFGGGTRSLQSPLPSKLPDDLPASESRVEWDEVTGLETQGRLADGRALVPATGIKGPLSHRTAFHANCRTRIFADDWRQALGLSAADVVYDKALHNDSVRRLFGWLPDGKAVDRQGQAGVLWWSDITLVAPDRKGSPLTAKGQTHNSIDRFTGGVRKGALFVTENLYAAQRDQPLLELHITLDLARAKCVGITNEILADFEKAIEDLCHGRLALGADGAGGQGFFKGNWSWQEGKPNWREGLAPQLTPCKVDS